MRFLLALLVLGILVGRPSRVWAEESENPVERARADFLHGTELARNELWFDALTAFEQAQKLVEHPVTTYNIGRCHLALGQATRAQIAFRHALDQNRTTHKGALDEATRQAILGLLGELDKVIVRLDVTLSPTAATVSVDGRPLAPAPASIAEGALPVLLGGVSRPGPAEPTPLVRFELWLDPGPHVLSVNRPGFTPATVVRTFAAGTRDRLVLELDRLPATLRITSDREGAVVSVDDLDVGVAPVTLSRLSGSYRVLVRKKGHVAWSNRVALAPGARTELLATLPEEKVTLTQRWWFWSGVGAAAVGVALASFFVARGLAEPSREPVDGGRLGWAAPLP